MKEKERKTSNLEERLEVIRLNLSAFSDGLLSSATAATDPITPKLAFKIIIYREMLSYRLVELAKGGLAQIDAGNFLSAVVLVRATFECAATHFYLAGILEKAAKNDCIEELDAPVMKLLLGSRWENYSHSAINILTIVDKAEKALPGARGFYDSLSEYAHPNFSGTMLSFSNPVKPTDVQFDRYPRNFERIRETAVNALEASLMMFENAYNSQADQLPRTVELCIRDLETN